VEQTKPGFLEPDTVAHAVILHWAFVYTIDTVDIATGWTEQRAVWGKGETGVLAQIQNIEQALPFPCWVLTPITLESSITISQIFSPAGAPVQFTRSRAYHKDDMPTLNKKTGLCPGMARYYRFDHPRFCPAIQ